MIQKLIDFDIRFSMFKTAIRFINYELIPGDILEFGVYTGRSLVLLAYADYENKKSIHKVPFSRKIVGFDSFEGLEKNEHPRWKKGLFKINHSYHPILPKGKRIDSQVTLNLFKACKLNPPELEIGLFSDTLPKVIGTKYTQAALIHIDCDLYKPTKLVLNHVQNIFQEGTIILFDDWYNFKGNPDKGEQKAFQEFLDSQNKWTAIDYHNYATFGKAFILSLKKD